MQRHRFDPLSLIPGLMFTAIGIAALGGTLQLTAVRWDWVWPVLLLVAGALLIPGGLRRREAVSEGAAPGASGEPAGLDAAADEAGDADLEATDGADDEDLAAALDELGERPRLD